VTLRCTMNSVSRPRERNLDWDADSRVENQIVSGLKYLQVVKRAGLTGELDDVGRSHADRS